MEFHEEENESYFSDDNYINYNSEYIDNSYHTIFINSDNEYKYNEYKYNKYIIMYNRWHDYHIKFISKHLKDNEYNNNDIKKNIPFNKLEYNLLNMQGGSLHNDGTRTPRSNSYSKYGV